MSKEPIDREALAALLARYGDSIASFDSLRPDSYEHALASVSLSLLSRFYTVIMTPGQTQAEASALCPRWPEGTKNAGKFPSTAVVSQVSERLRTASALNEVEPIGKFLDDFARRLKATPLGNNQAILDGVVGALGQKLIADVRDKKPIEANLKLIDRLQNQKRLDQNDARLAHDSRRITVLEEKLKLLKDQTSQARSTVNDTTLSPEEKQERIRQILGTE